MSPGSPSSDATPDFSGTAEAGSTLTLYTVSCSGAAVGSPIVVPGNGNWSIANVTVPLNTTTNYHVASVDPAGNVSPCSDARPYRHDNVKPPAPAVTGVSPIGPSNDQTPDIAGTSTETPVRIRLYGNAQCTGTVLGNLNGANSPWTILGATAAANATTTFYATATDAAGNQSACSTSFASYRHDSTAPNAPTGLATDPSPWSRTDSSPRVTGSTTEPNATVNVYPSADCTGTPVTTTTDGAGAFNVANFEVGPADIQAQIGATVTDAAGNVSGCSGNLPYRFDTTPPVVGTLNAPTLGSPTTTAINLTWAAATDNFTTAPNMVYIACISELCGAADCDFANTALPRYRTIAAGTTSHPFTGLTPNTRYYFKVMALDELTNRSTTVNMAVVSIKTQGFNNAVDLFVGESNACIEPSDATGSNRPMCWGPATVPVSSVADATLYSLGVAHSCAVQRNGVARCWGNGLYGKIGDGTTTERATPVNVLTINNAVQIDVGLEHTCALLADGRVMCWGRNADFQLGTGDNADQLTPVFVKSEETGNPDLAGIVEIAVGDYHGCGRRTNGDVWCWGRSTQLGTGVDEIHQRATKSLATNASQLVAGSLHTCALGADGRVRCWGNDANNQLGNGDSLTNALSPTLVASPTNVVSLGTSRIHTCAVTAAGAVHCWGNNVSGEIGTGTAGGSVGTPTLVPSFSGVVEVGGGAEFTCARKANGETYCWGKNNQRQTGSAAASVNPVLVPTLVTNKADNSALLATSAVSYVSIDNLHGCALVADGTARCWGRNQEGQLGNGAKDVAANPLVVVPGLAFQTAIEGGGEHSCALGADGTAKCWGLNDDGQIGDNSSGTDRVNPTTVSGLVNAKQLALGEAHTCALLADGTVRCWGKNANGQIGNGIANATDLLVPTAPTGSSVVDVVQIAVGARHTCALRANGKVWCWGDNTQGQAKASGSGNQATPFEVPGIDGAKSIAAGGEHSCAIIGNGETWCWGRNNWGQLGNNNTAAQTTPQRVLINPTTPLAPAIKVVAGGLHTCAVTAVDNRVYCWGDNSAGEIGRGNTNASALAVATTGSLTTTVEGLSAGNNNSCGFNDAGNAYCWGNHTNNALGVSGTNNVSAPTIVQCLP